MRRTGRNSLLVLLAVVLVTSLSLTAVGTTEGEEGGDDGGVGSTTTTIDSGLTPAVPVSDDEAAAPPADWTYRYLIPTGLILAAIVVLITAVKYFTDVVRKRYRIVEE